MRDKRPSEETIRKHNIRMRYGMEYKLQNRSMSTRAEKLLHAEFKKLNLKPVTQRIRFNSKTLYLMDFYFKQKRICVEVDGESHIGREKYDKVRDHSLARRGTLTVRVKNQQVYNSATELAQLISNFIYQIPKHRFGRKLFGEPRRNHSRLTIYEEFLKRLSRVGLS